MIRSFGLADVLLVRRLQRNSAPLAIEHLLTHPRPPLWLALTAPWPWAGPGVATFVLNDTSQGAPVVGFAQLLKRPARAEADLLHLAPSLPSGGNGDSVPAAVWRRLLVHCTLEAAQSGIERLYVSVPEGSAGQDCLTETGFRLYAREAIHRLAVVPVVHSSPAGFRQQTPEDSWALQRLYSRSTPRLVQMAEGANGSGIGAPPLSWWEPHRWRGIVWAPAGEVRGAVQVHGGRSGHWMRFWGASALTAREQRELVQQGLRLLEGRRTSWSRDPLPVYATARDYEIGLGGALTGFGFAPYADRVRFVKHTTATSRQAVPIALHSRSELPVSRSVPVETAQHSRN